MKIPVFFSKKFKVTMQEYGIIGYPLTHSFSPSFFNKKFEEEVNIIKKEIEYPVWFENKKTSSQ